MTAWFSRKGGDKGNVQIAIAVVLSTVLTAAVTGPMAYKAVQARDKVANVSAVAVAPSTTAIPTTTAPEPSTQPTTTVETTTTTSTTTTTTTLPRTTTTTKPAPTTTRPVPATTRPAVTTTTLPVAQTTTTTTVPACPANGLKHGLYQVSPNVDENQFTVIKSNNDIQPLVGPNFLLVGDAPKAVSTDVFVDDPNMLGTPLRTIGPCDYGSAVTPLAGKNINYFSRSALGLAVGVHTITIRYNGATSPEVLEVKITLL